MTQYLHFHSSVRLSEKIKGDIEKKYGAAPVEEIPHSDFPKTLYIKGFFYHIPIQLDDISPPLGDVSQEILREFEATFRDTLAFEIIAEDTLETKLDQGSLFLIPFDVRTGAKKAATVTA